MYYIDLVQVLDGPDLFKFRLLTELFLYLWKLRRPSLLGRLTMVEPKMARCRSPFFNGSAIVGEFKSKMAQIYYDLR